MNLLSANKLECAADVIQRLVFRIMWVTAPGITLAYVLSLFGRRHLLSVYPLVVFIAVPFLGAIVDGVRLKASGSSDRKS